jgi:hypothetical protein
LDITDHKILSEVVNHQPLLEQSQNRANYFQT